MTLCKISAFEKINVINKDSIYSYMYTYKNVAYPIDLTIKNNFGAQWFISAWPVAPFRCCFMNAYRCFGVFSIEPIMFYIFFHAPNCSDWPSLFCSFVSISDHTCLQNEHYIKTHQNSEKHAVTNAKGEGCIKMKLSEHKRYIC